MGRIRRRTHDRSHKQPAPELISSTPDAPGAVPKRLSSINILSAIAVVVMIVLAGGVSWHILSGGGGAWTRFAGAAVEPLTFVGSQTCAGCHQVEAELWRHSQHRQAMDHATEQTVLGDFSGATFDYYGVRSGFFRQDGQFLIETDGPDGKLAVFEVKYTFGVDPLQQYLVEFPDGRVQALSLAWDSRAKDQGGQRWFHLYPDEEIKHDDILHWTKLNQNWNFMCAECHSTGVRKHYDATLDRFATTWAEISVGCEACHGQGSRHVGWAQAQHSWWPFGKIEDRNRGLLVRFDERRDMAWTIDPQTGKVRRNVPPATLRKEVDTCGLCHARRGAFAEDWVPGQSLSDTHVVSPLALGLYHADGQMLDEVYNYGSFKQSKMFAAGVTCGDCHEPHSARLRAAADGVCRQCHAADQYATLSHHRHEAVNPALTCESCHMPTRTYMVVDRRHDHSFRIPRPDVSVQLGTPNACSDCHSDRPAAWAAAAIEGWHGPTRKGFQQYAEAFHAAWADRADAAALLAVVASESNIPAFVHASALSELRSRLSAANIHLAHAGLRHSDPMVRIGALDMLESVPGNQLWPVVSPLLSDANRGVRIRAAALLAAVPTASQPPADRDTFARAAAEFIAAQRLHADRPEARATLGNFLARCGLVADAETEYKAALRLSPHYAPAAINLADLYRQLGRDSDGEKTLRAVMTMSARDADLHYALGLTLTRLQRPDEALTELRQAAALDPQRARYAYVYAVALHSAGRSNEAMRVLTESLTRHPHDRDILTALLNLSREAGDVTGALEYAEQLAQITPDDQGLVRFIEELRRQVAKPKSP